ncbi:MAG TPA: hypothetical protein ACYCC8_01355 [Candidatus Azoamicus sp.]
MPIFIPNKSFASNGMNSNIDINLNISTGLNNKIRFKKLFETMP